MRIIAITGRAYTGKTYSATRLAERLKRDGYMIVIVGFGDTIKDIIRSAFDVDKSDAEALTEAMKLAKDRPELLVEFAERVLDVTYDYLRGTLDLDIRIEDRDRHIAALIEIFKRNDNVYRELAQYIGTELGRESIGEGIWLAVMHDKLKAIAHIPADTVVIIDDMRFENEYLFLRDTWGAEIYRTPYVSFGEMSERSGISIETLMKIYEHESERSVFDLISKYDIPVVDLD